MSRKNAANGTHHSVHLTAKNIEQKELIKAIQKNTITFVKGSPGSGKTFIAVSLGLQYLFNAEFEQLLFSRPVIEAAGERLGFLPGNMEEKIDPYMIPIFETLMEYLNEHEFKALISKEKSKPAIRVLPMAYMRGVAQPYYSKIASPSGWITMGDIKVGDTIFGSDGNTTKVIETYHHKNKKIYRVKFTDGTTADCCDEHLWLTKTLSEKRHAKPFSVKSTKQIYNSLKTRFRQKNHEIPLIIGVEYPRQDVPLDPYVLGLLLGDGCLHDPGAIQFTTADTEIIDYMQARLGTDINIKYVKQYDYVLQKSSTYIAKTNPVRDKIRQLNLLGTNSSNKFVPNVYKYNDKDTRIEILRGLLDTDGWIGVQRSGHRRIQFYTISTMLCNDIIEIVQSLGGIAHKRLKPFTKNTSSLIDGYRYWTKTSDIGYIWVVDILYDGANLFRLRRKADRFATLPSPRLKRLISDIEYIGDMECKCIVIENEDSLYLTDNFIVTHNTIKQSYCVVDEAQNTTPEQMRMLLTRLGEGSKLVVCGDVRQSDIHSVNGLIDAFSLLQGIEGIGFVSLTQNAIVRHPIIVEIEKRYEGRLSPRSTPS